jgi:hypothetical protein
VEEKGKRLPATARTAKIEGLVANEIYRVEIAAKSAAGEGAPAIVSRVRAAEHVVPAANATTLRKPNADNKYAPLVTGTAPGSLDYGVHLDPVPGILDAEVHYTTDGSTPTLKSPTFISGVTDSLQIRQDTTVRWVVVDSGNVVGPVGSKFFDIVESTNPAPEVTKVAATTVNGAVDVTFTKLTDPAVNAYRVQAYSGTSVDVATGVRVGDPMSVAQPTDANVTEVVRRMTGLVNGTPYKFSVAARYGTVWSNESALSAPVAPVAAASTNAGPDQTVLRGRTVTLDGTGSQKVATYQWTQIRPRNTTTGYQDPLLTVTTPTAAKAGFRFPTKSSPTSDDGSYQFRLTTTFTDGTAQRSDLVDIKEQRDAVAATDNRWRAGDDMTGTGSQENAQLRFHSGSATGPLMATAVVTGGEWSVPGTAGLPANSQFYVWSDFGFVGLITVTQ